MKRILYILLAVCLIFSLAACGSRSAKKPPKDADEASKALEDLLDEAENIDTAEEAENFVEDLTGWEIEQDGDEYTIKTGLGDDGGEVTFRTGDSIVWNSDNVGGLPQPNGTTIYMEADMSSILGEEYAYSYSINGLTKAVYKDYAELVKERFPNVILESNTDTEGTLMTTSEDEEETVLLTFTENSISLVQYMR
jgi:predicted small lipoprotein YifL